MNILCHLGGLPGKIINSAKTRGSTSPARMPSVLCFFSLLNLNNKRRHYYCKRLDGMPVALVFPGLLNLFACGGGMGPR